MPATPDDLFRRLAELDIETSTLPYPAHRTVEEGRALRGSMPGTFTKNLLLRDKKGRLFLVSAEENRAIDLKTLHGRVGANGRLGFAPAELMADALGVEPGTLTPFALINDGAGRVTVVLDQAMMRDGWLNFHPLAHTASTSIRPGDLMRFIAACGREAILVDFEAA